MRFPARSFILILSASPVVVLFPLFALAHMLFFLCIKLGWYFPLSVAVFYVLLRSPSSVFVQPFLSPAALLCSFWYATSLFPEGGRCYAEIWHKDLAQPQTQRQGYGQRPPASTPSSVLVMRLFVSPYVPATHNCAVGGSIKLLAE